MSAFKIRPTASVIKPILEQLQANGVDVSQPTQTLQTAKAFMAELNTDEQRQEAIGVFLRDMEMSFAPSTGFPYLAGGSYKQGKSVYDFLSSAGLITAEQATGKSDQITLDLAKMREIAASGFVLPTAADRISGGRGGSAARGG